MKFILIALVTSLAAFAVLAVTFSTKTRSNAPVAAAEPKSWAEVAAEANGSIGLVLIAVEDAQGKRHEQPVATAWVAPGGLLATNAHVAILAHEYPEYDLIVRFPGPDPVTVTVDRVYLHPGYFFFDLVIEESEAEVVENDVVPIADVALLSVVQGDSDRLPPALPIASESELEALAPLDEIAILGHPLERLVGSGSNPSSPTPAALFGTLTRITDHFFSPPGEGEGRLLHFDVPITGGVSGSPILNRQGQVIGLASAGNLVWIDGTGRIPLPVGNHFGQRVDWLIELAEDPFFGPGGWLEVWERRLDD